MLKFNKEQTSAKVTINGKERDVDIDTRTKTFMGKEFLNTVNDFEKRAWTATNDGIKTGFPMLDKAFCNGFVPGFYMIAADSNVGKSCYVTQLMYQMLDNNDNIFIMDFSLDDPMQDRVSRLVGSWVKMNSNEVKYPKDQSEEVIERRKLGMYKLANSVERLSIYDTNFGCDIAKIEQEVEEVKGAIDETTQLIVIIDSFHDLEIDALPSLTETAKFNKIAKWAADLAIKNDVILICTGEVRKSEKDNSRLGLNSIRESIKIRFEAKAIMLLYNEVHYKADSADIYFTAKDDELEKLPVLEVHIVKNKISSYKGRLFYYMWPSKGYLKECDMDSTYRFRSLI